MTKKTYDAVTSTSLLLIAAAALLFDRFPRFHPIFGALAIVCALVSSWVYLTNVRKRDVKTREGETAPGDAPIADYNPECSALQTKGFHLHGAFEMPPEADGLYVRDLLVEYFAVSSYKTEIVRARSFADEVVDIVRELSASKASPFFEFEFKPDGTFRIVPCTEKSPPRQIEERLEASEPRALVVH